MNPRPPEQVRLTFADITHVLAAVLAVVLVIAGLLIAAAFCSVLIADLLLRVQVLELHAMEQLKAMVLP